MRSNFLFKTWILAILLMAVLPMGAQCGVATQDQKDRLKDLAFSTKRRTNNERDNLRKARMELLGVYKNYDLNERKARAAIEKISQTQLNLLNIHLENQLGIRQILTQDQFAKFKEMVGKRRHSGGAGFGASEESEMDKLIEKTMCDDLNMSKDQEARAISRFKAFQKRMGVVKDLQRDTKQMMDIYSNYNLNGVAAKRLINKIHKEQEELLSLNFQKQQLLRSILTSDQFNQLVERLEKKMQNHPRPFHNRPGRDK